MSSKFPSRLGEFGLIARFFAPLAENMSGAYGLKDDAAVLGQPADRDVVVTADALVEGVHFLRDDPAIDVAKKALRVNLSDLAAKGASPHSYLLSLALPEWVDDAWLEAFAAGLRHDQELYGLALVGGDTTRTPGPLMIAITAHGTVAKGRIVRRGGASVGEMVCVTGTVGDAGAGLEVLRGRGEDLALELQILLIARYRVPTPRVELGAALIGIASAALDVSDGLLGDLGHIAEVSGVRIAVDAARVPVSPAVRTFWGNGSDAIIRAATAGDDYEIAFTAPGHFRERLAALSRLHGVQIHEIGCVEAGDGVVLLDADGRPLPLERLGFTHF